MVNIVIADDNQLLAEAVAAELETFGFNVTVFINGGRAFEYIKHSPPDLALLDIMMPGMDGISICKELKSEPHLKAIKTVIYTFKDFIEDEENAKNAGVNLFLHKRLKPAAIANAIKEFIEEDSYIRFWGTRGSLPVADKETFVYGGDTSCVEVMLGGQRMIFDCGTGIKKFGDWLAKIGNTVPLKIFLSHFHWDHIQGFPFFSPLYNPKNRIDIYGSDELGNSVQKTLEMQMSTPYFPLPFKFLSANLAFHSLSEGLHTDNDIAIRTIYANHPGNAFGFRISFGNKSVVYIPDNELSPEITKSEFGEKLVEFCNNADILIHDSQYTPEEYKIRKSWGHSTPYDALELAQKSKVKSLFLFHHDPSHNDECLDGILDECRKQAGGSFKCEMSKQNEKTII